MKGSVEHDAPGNGERPPPTSAPRAKAPDETKRVVGRRPRKSSSPTVHTPGDLADQTPTGPAPTPPAAPPRPAFLSLHPRCPYRPADWRYQRARLIADGAALPSRRLDDPPTFEAYRFLTALNLCRDEGDRETLARRMPDLAQAHELYTSEPPQRRWAVEARLLAREPFEAIASKSGITAGAVAEFERTYFAVLENMDKCRTDWLMSTAIGLPSRPGPAGQEDGTAWRLLGFLGGSHVVDSLVEPLPAPGRPGTPGQVRAFLHRNAEGLLRRKLMTAVMTLPVGQADSASLLKLYFRYIESERKAQERAPTVEGILPDIAAMWRGLPASFMDEPVASSEPPDPGMCR